MTDHTWFKICTILILLSVAISSCTSPLSPSSPSFKSRFRQPFIPTDIPPTPPYFVPGECRFTAPAGGGQCGELFVYEDRSDPNSRVITLQVGIFPSSSPKPEPDPLIFLIGGAGADALGSAEFYLGGFGAEIRAERDFILYNQRGVADNDPQLACPDEDLFWEELYAQNLDKSALEEAHILFLNDCRQGLTVQGINLDLYDSLAHAADLADLITALGYESANIYAVSYGTRTGLTLMRHYPDLVRSAILDGVLPPQINFPSDAISSFGGSLEALFSACADQSECRKSYPDLEGDLNQALMDLQSDPLLLSIKDQTIRLDHTLFLEAIFRLLHSSAALPDFPKALHNARQGDYSMFYDVLYSLRTPSPFITTGVNWSTICRDEVNFDSPENSQEQASRYPQSWQEYLDLSYYYTICEFWTEEPADPAEKTAVVSDIPTLLLSGHFDPITPSAWSLDTANFLENSYHFDYPNLAHGVLRSDSCALEMGAAFLVDPWTEPDPSCLNELGFPIFR